MTRAREPESLDAVRRSSGLSVDREGRVCHDGEPIAHPRLHDLFARGLDLNEDGEAIVRVGRQWAYVQCPGTPFVVQRLRWRDGALQLLLNTGAELAMQPADIQLEPTDDNRWTIRLQDGRRTARFGRVAWTTMAAWIDEDAHGRPILRLGSCTVPLPMPK